MKYFEELASTLSKFPPAKVMPQAQVTDEGAESGDDIAGKLLIENPGMSAATLLNLLKAKGLSIVDQRPENIKTATAPKPKTEAEGGAGANAAVLRANHKESSGVKINFRLLEGSAKDNGVGPYRFRAVLIEEGLGNLKDLFYYSREALEGAVALFEGKKIFADHPSAIDEKVRPERSVRDIVGYYENVAVEEGEEGQALVTSDVVMLPHEENRWARSLMISALEFAKKYPDKDFVGLSINASGDATPMPIEEFLKDRKITTAAGEKLQRAMESGASEIKLVNALTDIISVDLVTEAGAGGAIRQMLEQEKHQMAKDKKKETLSKKEEDAAALKKKEAEEAKAKEAEEKGKEAAGDKEEEDEAKNAVASEPHADEEQDIALIKKMLKDYLGDEAAESEEAMESAKEAIEAYKEMGKGCDEAIKCAGEALKLGHHMAKKKKEAEAKESADADNDDEKKESKHEACEGCKAKESAIAVIKGENAKLRESSAKIELADYLDKKLRESKQTRKITDSFRELVRDAKNKGEVDRLWESFKKGVESVAGTAVADDSFFVMTEKSSKPVTSAEGFGDCVK